MTSSPGSLIGEPGEIPQVGHHDDGSQPLALGAADLPGKDASPGLRPEIGVEQMGADPANGAGVDNRSKGRIDVFERRDVRVG